MLGDISKIVTSRSIPEVYRMNNLLSGMALVFSVSFLVLEQYKVPYMGVKSGLYILATSYAQAFILKYCAARYADQPAKFKTVRYGLGFLSGIFLYFLSWLIFSGLTAVDPHFDELRWIVIYIMISVFLNFIILALHDFVIVRRAKIQSDLENSRLQMRNTEAENILLRQQIHPHFLFNALNTMKVLYRKDQERGEEYLFRLTDFLRISVNQSSRALSTLEDELAVCINYLEMQKIRFGAALEWEIKMEDDSALQYRLPSFSLQPLVENAIKHNSLTALVPLVIRITQRGGGIEVSNRIHKKNFSEPSTRSGLENLAERYRIITGQEIIVKNDQDLFSVSLKFVSDEDCHHRR